MEKMKALVYLAPRTVELQKIDCPTVGENDVLIRIHYCGVCGTDIHIFEGESGSFEVKPPLVMGHEFSGIVEQIGKNVTRVSVGDIVSVDPNNMCGYCYYCQNGMEHFCQNVIGYGTTTDGGFAEYCCVDEKQVFAFKKDMDMAIASLAEPLSCCIHGIDLCDIKLGDDVLIIGGGPIGLFMLQLAKMAGANRLFLSEPVESKRILAEKLGATLTIDPLAADAEEQLKAHSKHIAVVIECVGNPRTIQDAIRWAGKGATVMMYGLTGPEAEVSIKPDVVFKKELKITASFINPYTFDRAVALLESGRIDAHSLIGEVVPLEKSKEVFYNDEYRRMGKILIQLK